MSSNRLVIPWPEFGDATRLALAQYTDDIEAALTKEAQRAANQTRKDIEADAPRDTGTYAKTWTVKKEIVDRKRPAYIVHAKKPGYQLAHLLERAHRIANQYGDNYGKTSPRPHIEKAAVKNGEQFVFRVTKIIQDLS